MDEINSIKKGTVGLLTTFFFIALVTTFILPGRPTPTVITEFFKAAAGAVRTTLGLSGSTPAAGAGVSGALGAIGNAQQTLLWIGGTAPKGYVPPANTPNQFTTGLKGPQ